MNETEPSLPKPALHEVVIAKEDAVFWMDGQGRWHNRHGRFEHKRIIDYFNRSIRRDEAGYFVTQIRGDVREKVYFPYEDTPFFVVRVLDENPIRLVLNTGSIVELDPDRLFVRGDHLYLQREDERVRFTSHALMAMAKHLEDGDMGLMLRLGDQRWPILPHLPPS